jgi:hypothetical protein
MKARLLLLAVIPGLAFAVAVAPGTPAGPYSLQLQSAAGPSSSQAEVPAYHAGPPKDALPATLDPAQFSDPSTRNSYAMAARVKKILYQQPCYCLCDRHEGHKSLLDCFVGNHASICGICKKEGIYAYEQARQGKTAAQIRAGIIKGGWYGIDLSKYEAPLSLK